MQNWLPYRIFAESQKRQEVGEKGSGGSAGNRKVD